MTENQWRGAYEAFEAICALPAKERLPFLENAVLDAEAKAEVRELLAEWEAGPGPEAVDKRADIAEHGPSWPHLGKRIGRFEVGESLGRGGMGEVYRAFDTELNRDVALKFLSPGSLGSAGGLDRFLREAQAASALNHPGIVTVHEVIRSIDSVAIVMELIDGTALRTRCGPPQPIAQVADWGRQIAQALAAAHAAGITHRDIKPENLMLRRDGYVKVLDFGLARRVDAAATGSTSGLLTGTIRYMSPEQANGRAITARSDIFSLGIVLYELATGVHPFAHDSAFETVHLILTARPAAPSVYQPTLPASFDALILAMLNKEPERRPAAEAVTRGLGVFAGAIPGGPIRRRIPVSGLAVLAVLFVEALAGVAIWRGRPAPSFAGATAPPLLSEPLTSQPGNESDPAFSPDGRQIAYTWAGDSGTGNRSIYVKLAGSGNPVRLTGSAGDESNPTWSPDASQIAFLRYSSKAVEVVTVGALGGGERVVSTVVDASSNGRSMIAWSPDPEELAIADSSPLKNNRLRLYALRIGSGERRPLTIPPDDASDMQPAFSPDGNHLAFLRYQGGATFRLYVTSPKGGTARLLATAKGPIQGFAWDADSRSIVYSWGLSVPDQIWRVPLQGGGPAPIPFDGEARQLAIAPHGGRIAFVRQNLDSNIWAMTLGGDRVFHKLIASTREDEDPQFSPDSSRISFTSRRSGKFELWVCQRDGSSPRAVTAQGAYAGSSSWSPDGRMIAYDSLVTGRSEVWLVNVNGGTPRRLLQPPGQSMMPKWSSDGAWVYFFSKVDDAGQIWKAPVAGGSPVRVTKNGGFEGTETPDGRFFYFVKPNGSPGLWRLPVAGGPEEQVSGLNPFSPYRYWTMAKGGVYWADADPKPALKFFDLRSQRIMTVGALPAPPLHTERGLAVSPDGQSVLYTQIDTSRREIMVADGFR